LGSRHVGKNADTAGRNARATAAQPASQEVVKAQRIER
jgi:hypothetical protein